jgi:hypothetical protein
VDDVWRGGSRSLLSYAGRSDDIVMSEVVECRMYAELVLVLVLSAPNTDDRREVAARTSISAPPDATDCIFPSLETRLEN